MGGWFRNGGGGGVRPLYGLLGSFRVPKTWLGTPFRVSLLPQRTPRSVLCLLCAPVSNFLFQPLWRTAFLEVQYFILFYQVYILYMCTDFFMAFYYELVQLSQVSRATTSRLFTSNLKVHRSSWYSFDWPQKDERWNQSWFWFQCPSY